MTESKAENELLQIELLGLVNPEIYKGVLAETPENHQSIHLVNQGNWSAASARTQRYLASFGANPCFIISIYDTPNQRGALSHIDDSCSAEMTLHTMRGTLSYPTPGLNPQYLVTLVGGDTSSMEAMSSVLSTVKFMEKMGHKIGIQVGNIRQSSASLALDLTDGTVYKFQPHPQLSTLRWNEMESLMGFASGKKSAKPDRQVEF